MSRTATSLHPGVFLEEELEARGWSQADLAEILGKSATDISLIIKGKRAVTPETAIALGDAFETGPEFWMNLETLHQLSQTRNKQSDVSLKAKLYAKFPVREMVKRGWVEWSKDIEVSKQRFFNFFHISSFNDPLVFPCAKKAATTPSNPSQDAWLFRAGMLAKACPVTNKFSTSRLATCKAKLKLLLHELVEIRHVPKLLAEAGIRLIIIEHMPGSKIDGATFWLNDDSPVVVLSLRRDRIDNFWFTLMHELSHVEHGEGKDLAIIDIDLLSEDESEKSPIECRADFDAAEFCIPAVLIDDFIIRVHPYYLESKVIGFSLVNKIHPGILVGQLQYKQRIPFSHHRKHLVKVREVITSTAMTDGYGHVPSI